MGSFPRANRHDEQVQRSVEEEENIAGVVNSEVLALVYKVFLPTSVFCASVSRKLRRGVYPCHIEGTWHLTSPNMSSRLEFCRWIDAKPQIILNIFFIDDGRVTPEGVKRTRDSLPFT